MSAKSPITTHVLDTSRGCPAAGIAVQLERLDEAANWRRIGEGVTNADGRIAELLDSGELAAGRYRLTFAVGDYFSLLGVAAFYPQVAVEFEIDAPGELYHVPLLLSPFGYSTYRGS